MVSWGEILVTVTAAGYLLGRKELPKIARVLGNYSGRSVGAIVRAKKEFFDATKDSELVKLQQEFQKGIAELNEIRSELTSVGNISRPMQPQGSAPVAGTPSAGGNATSTTTGSSSTSGAAAASSYYPAGQAAAGHGECSQLMRMNAHCAANSVWYIELTACVWPFCIVLLAAAVSAPIAGRSSLSLASMDYAALEDAGVERSAEASLAIAEMKLAQQGKFAPRLESVEGGADYVSASIVDSLLLQKVASTKPTKQ